MTKPSKLGPGWTAWQGRAGFSYKVGNLRCDMAPVPGTRERLTFWRAEIWRGDNRSEILATLDEDNHWDLAREVTRECARLQGGGK